ncbi:MAG: YIP1 family protein [Ignavibacteria bacterium]|nr:YIP1 family protein [Ignavibacteria bacterium]
MITCSICETPNDDFAVLCVSCRSYLQAKVDNLNLFETVWGLMESPGRTFRRIVLSYHKNYVLLLSSLFGVFLVYAILWLKNVGHVFDNVLTLLGFGVVIGPFLGVLSVVLLSLLVGRLASVFGGKLTFRNAYAVTSYAMIPTVIFLAVVFPIQIAIFGIYLFDRNPSPMVLQPAIYVALMSLCGLSVLWSWLLLVGGTSIAAHLRRGQSLVLAAVLMIVAGIVVYTVQQA